MSVSVYFSTGLQPENTLGYDHAVGLEPTSLNLKIHHNLGLLGSAPGPLPDKVLGFLLTGIGLWAADKIVPRQQARDAWTRRLRLSCPEAGGPNLWRNFLLWRVFSPETTGRWKPGLCSRF